MKKLNKEMYINTQMGYEHKHLGIVCDCCHDLIEEGDFMNVDVKYILDQNISMEKIEDELRYMDSDELEDITDKNGVQVDSFEVRVERGLVGQGIYCDHCFDIIDKPNPETYEDFLDLLFEKFPDKGEYYKPILSVYVVTNHSGSSKVINKIVNSLYAQDYYEIKLDELGILDTGNYNMIKSWLWEFGGVNIDTMKAAANRKAKLLNQSYSIALDEELVSINYKNQFLKEDNEN